MAVANLNLIGWGKKQCRVKRRGINFSGQVTRHTSAKIELYPVTRPLNINYIGIYDKLCPNRNYRKIGQLTQLTLINTAMVQPT